MGGHSCSPTRGPPKRAKLKDGKGFMGVTKLYLISGLLGLISQTSWALPQDRMWREAVQLPVETQDLRRKFFERLEQDPLECHSLTDPIKNGEQLVPVAHHPKLMAEFAAKLSEQTDARCMRALAQSYAFHLGYLPWERPDFLDYCRTTETSLCRKAKELSARHNQNLLNILAMSEGDRGTRILSDVRDCQQSPLSLFQGLYEGLRQKREVLNCIDLKPGQTKVIAYQDGQPSGLGGDYSLTKRPDGDFDVGIAIEVRDERPERRDEMQARIKNCIAEANGFFKGPRGESLRFNIMTREEARQLPVHLRPGTNRITIQPENARSNAAAYAANINCATIVHEVLHLTGLCDEYNGDGDGHTCRAVVRQPSIMSDNGHAYDLAMPKNLRCECQAPACTDVLSSGNQAKRDFYLKKTIYSMTEYRFRNQHCTEKILPTIRWREGQNLAATSLTTETPLRVVALTQEFFDRKDVVHRRETSCTCKPSDTTCAEGLRTFAQKIREQKDDINPGCPYGSRGLREKGPQEWDGKVFGLTVPPELPSLLHPNQFQRITGGACATRAQTYNQCAVWAYKSKEQTNNCQGRPDFCDDERVFLGVPK